MSISDDRPPVAESAGSMRGHKRYRQHGNPFSIRGPAAALDLETIYGRRAPLALDIGFGGGSFLLELARQHREWNVLGLEIRRHFVDGVLAAAKEEGLANLHAVLANANLHLRELVPSASVTFVSLNFPDPWYKRRHHKRRVLNDDWLGILIPKMQQGAELHVMTDYEPLAVEARAALEGRSELVPLQPRGTFANASTTGIMSERERTHLARGEPIFRLRFRHEAR